MLEEVGLESKFVFHSVQLVIVAPDAPHAPEVPVEGGVSERRWELLVLTQEGRVIGERLGREDFSRETLDYLASALLRDKAINKAEAEALENEMRKWIYQIHEAYQVRK